MTRKMQIFYSTIIFELIIILFAMFLGVTFTSDNLTVILQFTLLFAMVMAGANVGEWFAKKPKTTNGVPKETENKT